MSSVNPYAPPKANVEDFSGASSDVESERLEHIKHEASVRSIGSLYYVGGFLMLLIGVPLLLGFAPPEPMVLPVAAFYCVLGTVSVAVAWGLRRLRRWAGGAAVALSGLTLLIVPAGTIVGGYMLFVLLSAKGQRVFARDYAEIVAATPHLKHRAWTPILVALGAFALMVALVVAINILAG